MSIAASRCRSFNYVGAAKARGQAGALIDEGPNPGVRNRAHSSVCEGWAWDRGGCGMVNGISLVLDVDPACPAQRAAVPSSREVKEEHMDHLRRGLAGTHRSYLHGHSGISRASSRHSGGNGRLRESGADLGHGSARLLGRPRDPLVPGSRLQTHGPAGSGDRLSVIMQPHRWMGPSRRPPIGWPQRGPGVRRPRVPSGLLEPRPLCRSTSRQASVREMPNVEAPGCVPGRRTRLIAGRWSRCPTSGGRAIDVSGSATTLRSWSSRTSVP
jgi:hypothetical protein